MNATVKMEQFSGLAPKIDPKRLPSSMAQTAENCRLAAGVLEPIQSPTEVLALTAGNVGFDPSTIETFFKWRYRDSGTDYEKWLYWASQVDVCEGSIFDDEYNRIYYTENGTLKVRSYNSSHDPAEEARTISMPTPDAVAWDSSGGVQPLIDDTFIASLRLKHYMIQWATTAGSSNTLYYEEVAAVNYNRSTGEIFFQFTGGESAEYPHEGVIDRFFVLEYTKNSTTRSIPESYITTGNAGGYPPSMVAPKGELPCYVGTTPTAAGELVAYLWLDDFELSNYRREVRRVSGTDNDIATLDAFGVGMTLNFREANGDLNFEADAYYVQTFVNEYGEEGPPSEISEIINKGTLDKIILNDLGEYTGGDDSITNRRLYRTAGTGASANFWFLAELDIETTTYNDESADKKLGEKLEMTENPPSTMYSLVRHPNGFFVSHGRRDVYFSLPWKPYSWPDKWFLVTDYDIVGLAVSSNAIYVLTEGYPYRIVGDHPSTIAMETLAFPQPCVSKESIVSMDNAVFYASPDGYVALFYSTAPRLITRPLYKRREWQALTPSTMRAEVHDNVIVLSHNSGTILFEPSAGRAAITTTTIQSIHFFKDLVDDVLYFLKDDGDTTYSLQSFGTSTDKETLVWKTHTHLYPQPVEFQSIIVDAESYPSETPIQVTLYSETANITVDILSNEPIRMPVMRPEREWAFKITSTVDIHSVTVATSMRGLRV
jgi:hypothetical protein